MILAWEQNGGAICVSPFSPVALRSIRGNCAVDGEASRSLEETCRSSGQTGRASEPGCEGGVCKPIDCRPIDCPRGAKGRSVPWVLEDAEDATDSIDRAGLAAANGYCRRSVEKLQRFGAPFFTHVEQGNLESHRFLEALQAPQARAERFRFSA